MDWARAQEVKCLWKPELKEVTTPEVWDRLHAQVFEIRDTNRVMPYELRYLLASFLVKDQQVYPMGSSPFGPENLQLLIFDIDGDSKDELLYAYEWGGSGISRSLAAAYRFNGPRPAKIQSRFDLFLAPLTLKVRDEQTVDVYTSGHRLGELTLVRLGKDEVLDVKLDPNLPKKLKDVVCRMPPRKK